ncbi:MAG: gliding motility-associated C-terminal domain-containing protein, partial [Saprospiraceae bacterium]
NVEKIEQLNIFDRWGNLIYEQHDFLANQITEGWDGKSNNQQIEQGTYLYQAIVLFVNGERKTVAGDVFLLR